MKKQNLFSLFCIVIFLLLLSLGTWQIGRMQWKSELIKEMKEKSQLPAEELSGSRFEPFRKIFTTGKFLHDRQILLDGKYVGKTLGYNVITPLKTDDLIILVNRGWVAKKDKDKIEKDDKEVKIEGHIKKTISPPWFFPKNIPEQNMWLWADIEQLSEYLEKQTGKKIESILVQQTNKLSDFPIIVEEEIKLRNDHLQYAITWFALAFVVGGMLLFYMRQKP